MQEMMKIIIVGIAGAMTWVFRGWNVLLIVTCAFMLIDYITGLVAAIINHTLSSSVGWKGILKKLLMLIAIGAGALLDKVLPQDTIVCQSLVCLYYVGNEGVSIIENVGRAGVPIPAKIRVLFEKLKEDNDNGNSN